MTPLTTRATAQRFDIDGYEVHPVAAPSRGSSELAVWSIRATPGAASVTHQHDREVVFVVSTGRMVAVIGDERFEAGPGDAFIVPPKTDFTLSNASADDPASLTVATTVGMHAFVDGEAFPPPWTL
ncbi:cupin [Actinosynnema sp. ALI-1.44]|uniref:cupin domain-containing protein n=1 Tax=Actinosynnema sp. ALI-1.44 TaxID=1933779 RepID=UPI00097C5157|nr:cupin domain-containing protein [Actinosynnema sp. ALI-1.44]ONI87475.1 cupin [Actinosynnema sp. ALI-1.44]